MKNLTKFSILLFCTIFMISCGKEEVSPPSQDLETEIRLYPWDVVNPAGLEYEIWQGGMVWSCGVSIGSNVWAATQAECECELALRVANCLDFSNGVEDCCKVTLPCFRTSSKYPPVDYDCEG